MAKRRQTRQRRKAFLLDSNQAQQERKAPKTWRNRLLNLWFRLGFVRDIGRMITTSRLLGLAIFCMAAFVVFAMFSPYFELKQITVSRDNPNIDAEAIELALEDFYGQNLLFLDKDQLTIHLSETFPAFREIIIKEVWPASLSLKIELSPPAYTLLNQTDAAFRVVSADGVILSDNASEALPLIKVFDYTKPLIVGTRFVEKELLDQIQLAAQLMEQQIKLPVDEIHLYPIAREVHLIAQTGTAFWLDLQLDIEGQLKKIEYGANQVKLFSRDIEHVDLRIPNQLYWKPR